MRPSDNSGKYFQDEIKRFDDWIERHTTKVRVSFTDGKDWNLQGKFVNCKICK